MQIDTTSPHGSRAHTCSLEWKDSRIGFRKPRNTGTRKEIHMCAVFHTRFDDICGNNFT